MKGTFQGTERAFSHEAEIASLGTKHDSSLFCLTEPKDRGRADCGPRLPARPSTEKEKERSPGKQELELRNGSHRTRATKSLHPVTCRRGQRTSRRFPFGRGCQSSCSRASTKWAMFPQKGAIGKKSRSQEITFRRSSDFAFESDSETEPEMRAQTAPYEGGKPKLAPQAEIFRHCGAPSGARQITRFRARLHLFEIITCLRNFGVRLRFPT